MGQFYSSKTYNMTTTLRVRTLYIYITFCFIQISIAWAQTTATTDSLMYVIDSSKGESKLDAYYAAYTGLPTPKNTQQELGLLHAYQAEAEKQNNAKHEMMARTLRLYTFYNNHLYDSLYYYMDRDLAVFEKHQQWDYYYSCRSLLIESYRYANRLQSALKEAQLVYDDALIKDNNYGKGVAAYLIASCYQNLNRNAEAVTFFKEAESYMLKENNVGQLHNLYGIAWNSFVAASQYDELAPMMERWNTMWLNYCKDKEIELPQVASYYLVYVCANAHMLIDQGHFVQARQELDFAATLAQDQLDISKMLWLKEEARYAEATGNHQTALAYIDQCYALQVAHNNRIAAANSQEMRAGMLLKLGQTKEAAALYATLLLQKDSIIQLDMAAQLDDLSTIYKVDKLNMEKTELRLWLTIIAICCVVLLLLLAGHLYYNQRLQAKNRAIFQQYQKQKSSEEFMEQILTKNSSTVSSNKDMELFLKIKKYLRTEHVLSDPLLDRNRLADALGTNYTYISNAIQTGAGVSVNAYINQVRIDYACELLKREVYSITDIQFECGFQSRTTFYRAFKKQINMNPTEFKKELEC